MRALNKQESLAFAGLLGARSAGLEFATFSVRSHSPSGTGRDSGGQGETNQRFYQSFGIPEGTQRDRETPGCGQNTRSTKGIFTSMKSSYLRRSRVFGHGGPLKRKLFS